VKQLQDCPWSGEAAGWNAEYSGGHYDRKAPVPLVDDILKVERCRNRLALRPFTNL